MRFDWLDPSDPEEALLIIMGTMTLLGILFLAGFGLLDLFSIISEAIRGLH